MAQSLLSLPHDALSRMKMLKELRDRIESPPIDDHTSSTKRPEANNIKQAPAAGGK